MDARKRLCRARGRQALDGLGVSTDGQTVTGEWSMTATEFRAKCFGLIDEVAATGPEIVITKRGRAVARLVPVRASLGAWFGRGSGHHRDPRRHRRANRRGVGGGD